MEATRQGVEREVKEEEEAEAAAAAGGKALPGSTVVQGTTG